MLKVKDLESLLKSAISSILVPALELCKLNEYPRDSKIGKLKAKEYAKLFDELVSEDLAKSIANAIDYYVKNISITGTIITVGSPGSLTAKISSIPTPIANGKVPNTLGVS